MTKKGRVWSRNPAGGDRTGLDKYWREQEEQVKPLMALGREDAK